MDSSALPEALAKSRVILKWCIEKIIAHLGVHLGSVFIQPEKRLAGFITASPSLGKF